MRKKNIRSSLTALALSCMMLSATACGSSNVAGEEVDKSATVSNENNNSVENNSDDNSDALSKNGENEKSAESSSDANESAMNSSGAKPEGSDNKSEGTSADYISKAKKKAGEKTDDKSSQSGAEEGEVGIVELTDHFLFMLADDSKADYSDIRYYVVDDFDNDGSYEGFFYVGAEADVDFGECQGAVWFVNESGTQKLHESSFYIHGDNELFDVIEPDKVGGKKFVAFDDAYATQLVSNIFYVDGKKCRDSAVSGIGNAAIDEKSGDLVITLSAYDGYCDYQPGVSEPMWSGHTWKPYYFYYDRKSGDFKQYDAKEITPELLKQSIGKDVVAEIEKEGYTVDRIIERANGIININYSKTTMNNDGSKSTEYKNATYDESIKDFVDVWGDGNTGVFASDYGGIYEVLLP